MKNTTYFLRKTQKGNSYRYEAIERSTGTVIATRKSDREYVAVFLQIRDGKQRIQELEDRLAAANKAREAMSGTIQELEVKLEQTEERLQDRDRKLSDARGKIQGLEQRLDDSHKAYEDLAEQARIQEAKIKMKDEKIQDLVDRDEDPLAEEKIQRLEGENKELAGKILELLETQKGLEGQISEKDQIISYLQGELGRLGDLIREGLEPDPTDIPPAPELDPSAGALITGLSGDIQELEIGEASEERSSPGTVIFASHEESPEDLEKKIRILWEDYSGFMKHRGQEKVTLSLDLFSELQRKGIPVKAQGQTWSLAGLEMEASSLDKIEEDPSDEGRGSVLLSSLQE